MAKNRKLLIGCVADDFTGATTSRAFSPRAE
ncbi:four-carbon acid sugar kinase family protein [Ensifer aridi]|nr:four-carbon acid sugar kinase family protein [Ensifer aridi]